MRFLLILICTSFYAFQASGFQKNDAVATINGNPITKGELIYAFKKNRPKNEKIQVDSLEKYLAQYINFKLKVLEAEKLGIDTTNTFKEEYEGYISQVQKPYMQNPVSELDLIQEAYDRMKYEINASHILIRINNANSPADTLQAYQKIDSVRNLALNEKAFEELAKKYSSDGSSKNGGSLGWFSSMAMVYPFESGAYNTPVGGISKIVRSQFGYHIIKVNDKREARGKVKTSHIFLTKNGRTVESGRQLIQNVYDSIQNGGDWKQLCIKYSEDTQTKQNGGALPFAGNGELPDEFLNGAHSIATAGTIGEPLETSYGWHIIRLDAKQGLPSFESLKDELSEKIRRSGRNQLDSEALIRKLKTENGFEQDFKILETTIEKAANVGLANLDLSVIGSKVIFKIGKKAATYSEYFSSLGNANQLDATALWSRYKVFERDEILKYEDSQATSKYPEFGYLMNEYKEGLMLFEIMEKEIWNEASEDSLGLSKFFEANIKNFPAPERGDFIVIETSNEALFNKILDSIQVNWDTDIENQIKSRLDPKELSALKIAKRTFERHELPNFDPNWKEKEVQGDPSNLKIYSLQQIIEAGYYRLEEVKGLVISDYQDHLEQQWVKQLRSKNKIKIDHKILKQIASDENK
jgi:peptidyl-prolyl cis-trans isomerase SurA